MWFNTVLFILTFIVSAASSVIGIMVAYQLYQTHQKPVLQVLLYQQIFLISFFVYGIWGNIALHEILADLSISAELNKKLSIFIPVLGIPFLVISWFMLLRFSIILNGLKESITFPLVYFPLLFFMVIGFSVLVQKDIIKVESKPDLFIIKALVVLNFINHLLFIIPFTFTKKNRPLSREIRFLKKHAILYVSGVLIYSVVLWFYNILGAFSICFSILLLFAVSISIPVFLKLSEKTQIKSGTSKSISFIEFCKSYEISNREAEIVLEICTGKTNKAISEKLFITLQTVKDHNYRIYSKLGVKSRIQLTNLVREKTGM